MAEELIHIAETAVTVDAATAAARGDDFIPTDDDDGPVDNNGDSINPHDRLPAGDDTITDVVPKEKTPAAADTTVTDDDAAIDKATGQIPKSRFNEVNNARKTAETRADLLAEENARLKALIPTTSPTTPTEPESTTPKFDMRAQEKAYADALLEGDTDKALEIRGTINDHILQEAETRATTRVNADMTARQAQHAVQQAADQAVTDFPYLDTPEGAMAMGVIVQMRNAYAAQGLPMHQALSRAVTEIAPRFAPAGFVAPRRDSTAAAPAVDTRSANAMARGAADSNLQPPSPTGGMGNRATETGRVNVTQLTEKQFEALTPEEKRKLRGD